MAVVLKVVFVKTLDNVSYMQDMTSAICANTVVGTQKVLTDSRDNKTYRVRKLNDNRCWMTQNAAGGTYFAISGSTATYYGDLAYTACPTNWGVPSSDEFRTMYTAYNSNANNELFSNPLNYERYYDLNGSVLQFNNYPNGPTSSWWTSSISTYDDGISWQEALRVWEKRTAIGSDHKHSYYKNMVRCIVR